MPKLPKFLETIVADEQLYLPIGAAWLVGGPLFTIWGFYTGTVLGPNHAIDLQWNELSAGLVGALVGAGIGLGLAIFATFVFPRLRAGDGEDSHGH